jgi:hypothetical protein
MVAQLGRQQEAATEAVLADGSHVTLESFACHVEWFGQTVRAQVIGNTGKLPLLGTELLAKRKLLVDYTTGLVSIDCRRGAASPIASPAGTYENGPALKCWASATSDLGVP